MCLLCNFMLIAHTPGVARLNNINKMAVHWQSHVLNTVRIKITDFVVVIIEPVMSEFVAQTVPTGLTQKAMNCTLCNM